MTGQRPRCVRRATEEDIDAVLRVLGTVADEGMWLLTPRAEDFARRRSRFVESVLRPDVGIFVVQSDHEIVGELSLIPEAAGLYGLGMAIARESRGRGAGSALMEAAIAWACGEGAHKIVLEVFPHNTAARALYEKFGFRQEGYHERHYRRPNGDLWDAIAMGLLLQDAAPDTERVVSTEFRIRRAHAADIDAVSLMQHALWPDESAAGHASHLRALFAGSASNMPLTVIVAERKSDLIGFIEVGMRSHANGCDPRRPIGFIEGWYVKSAHRRKGIGRALVEAAEEWARRHACVEMASDAVLGNVLSRDVHERLGYALVDACLEFRKSLRDWLAAS